MPGPSATGTTGRSSPCTDSQRRPHGSAATEGKLGFTNEELVRDGLRPLRLPIGRPKTKKEQPAAVQKQQQGGGTASPAVTKPED